MVKPYIDSKKKDVLLDEKLQENLILKEFIKAKLHLTEKEIATIIEREKEIVLPISIFRNKLSTLEIIVKFLKEVKLLNFSEISRLLGRDERTIWHAYQRAIRKNIEITVADSDITIPVSLFASRDYSPLETVVAYLKDSHQLKFNEIAALLDLSPKTIWTVYNRKQKKNVPR